MQLCRDLRIGQDEEMLIVRQQLGEFSDQSHRRVDDSLSTRADSDLGTG